MNVIEYLDRVGERRLARFRIAPPRPRDSKLLTAVLFFAGYYVLIFTMLKVVIPEANAPLVRDALLVLGPVIGAIGQSVFRDSLKDEMATSNTGEAFRANRAASEATKAAADSIPNVSVDAGNAAGAVASAAADRAAEFTDGARNV